MSSNSNPESMTHTAEVISQEETSLNPQSGASNADPHTDLIQFENFVKEFEELKNIEDKLHFAVGYMRQCLEHREGPFFREFWESRKLCLPLFKETIPRIIKSQLWKDYTDLTREGRRLKSLLDEETAYAVEQIDLAISSIEEDVSKWEANMGEISDGGVEETLPEVKTLKGHIDQYLKTQRELNLLNTFAARVHAMRKELLKQEMRVRQKNQFFNQLSSLGDRIFPPRRDLIKAQSELFLKDVSFFVERYFSPETFSAEEARRSVFFYRDEIKSLQAFAKLLTLNTHTFTSTREQLSNCWDMLKGIEKELKKEMNELKSISHDNANLVRQKMQEFSEKLAETPLDPADALRQLQEIAYFMREVDLVRDDVRRLKEELEYLKAPFQSQQEQEEKDRKKKVEEVESKRKEAIEQLKQRIRHLREAIDSLDIATLRQNWEDARAELGTLKANKAEKQPLETEMKMVRDLIADKEKQAVLSLSGEDLKTLESLEEILSQRKTRRTEIKTQVEDLRRIVGGSGLDFEKAMTLSGQLAEERERLENVDEGISEIEQKIRNLKNATLH